MPTPSDLPKSPREYVLNEIENTIELIEGHEYPDMVFMDGSNAMLDALRVFVAGLDDEAHPLIVSLGAAIKKSVDDAMSESDFGTNPYHSGECDCAECYAACDEGADEE